MPIAAVPNYLGQDFSDASPGLRFGLYLSIWTARKDQEDEVRKRAEAQSREGQRIKQLLEREGVERTIALLRDADFCEREHLKQLPPIFSKNDFAAKKAWANTCRLNNHTEKMHALLSRQRAAFAARAGADTGLCIEAKAVAPFTTGLGNEHPLENGFAFLNPYGLPYLPGSGVKGVVRRAAQELADGIWGKTGWSNEPRYRLEIASGKEKRTLALAMLDVLFGREPASGDSDHVRGALTFWDVIPQIAGNSLMVEIMTPHQSHYYQWKKDARNNLFEVAPHESGQPTPISFLTVPPGSTFVFHVVCDHAHLARLAPDLAQRGDDGRPRWQTLIEEAFKHAFEWLGFGAKTAVGYGAMKPLTPTAFATEHGAAQPVASQVEASSSATETIWMEAKLTFNPGSGEIKAHYQGKTTAGLKGDAAQKLIESLGDNAARLKKAKELKNVPVRVRQEGNLIVLIGVEADLQ